MGHFGSYADFFTLQITHGARLFWLEAENIIQGYCIGRRAAHNISLEYLLSFFRAYKDKPKFSLVTHAVISHQDLNPIGYVGDDDLKSILPTMENENFLKNTILVIFGDHEIRFSGLRKTIQGTLEGLNGSRRSTQTSTAISSITPNY